MVDPHLGVKLTAPTASSKSSVFSPQSSVSTPEAASTPGPQRIISLVPSVTELLVQWGLAARIVGRTRYCIEPRWIRNSVPTVGGTKDPDLGRIRDLAPDLVILEKDENPKEVADALTALGIPWLVLEIRTLEACVGALRLLGTSLGVAEVAEARAAALEGSLKGQRRRGPRALALIWKDPWMSSGPDTYLGDLLRQGGLTPIGPKRYPTLTEADLEALSPQIILLPTEPYRFHRRHQAELQRCFPAASVHLLDGRALTWYLSRTEEGLELIRSLG
jgi:ABC-type Fe3+-hydroxamate transport system substrate-binding protein